MREIIKEVISSGVYNLSDLLRKINTLWLQASLTDQERDELIQFAQENANPEYGNPVDLVCMRPSGKKKRDKVHLSQYALKEPCIHQNG